MKNYLEQLEQLERLPENHFCFNPVTGTPEVPISSRKPQLRFISFHPRNHQNCERRKGGSSFKDRTAATQ